MAYGARLESVLGESPRGFESPILRVCDLSRHRSYMSREIVHIRDLFIPSAIDLRV